MSLAVVRAVRRTQARHRAGERASPEHGDSAAVDSWRVSSWPMAIPGPNRRFHRSASEPRRGGRRNPDLAAPPGARAPAVARVGAALRWDDGLGSEQRPLDGGRPDGVLGRCVLPVHDRVHPRAAAVPTGSVPDTIGDRASVHRGCGTAPLAPPARSRSTIRHRGAAAAVHASSARARAGVAAARTRRPALQPLPARPAPPAGDATVPTYRRRSVGGVPNAQRQGDHRRARLDPEPSAGPLRTGGRGAGEPAGGRRVR